MKLIAILAAVLSLSGCATYSGNMFARDVGYVLFGAAGLAVSRDSTSTYRPDIYKRPLKPAVNTEVRRQQSNQQYLHDLHQHYYGNDN